MMDPSKAIRNAIAIVADMARTVGMWDTAELLAKEHERLWQRDRLPKDLTGPVQWPRPERVGRN